MKKGIYANIIDLAKQNGTYEDWTDYVSSSTLEDYLDNYSDRNIVEDFLSDMIGGSEKFEVTGIWDQGCLSWRRTKIEIL